MPSPPPIPSANSYERRRAFNKLEECSRLPCVVFPMRLRSLDENCPSQVSRWIVRAKVFDGLIVEPSCTGPSSAALRQVLADATAACDLQGWNVLLLEKPLYGLQDQHLSTISAAREVMRQS